MRGDTLFSRIKEALFPGSEAVALPMMDGALKPNRRLDLALAGLGTGGPDDTLRAALRRALADPTLDIVYAKLGSGGWLSGLGEHMDQPATVISLGTAGASLKHHL